MISSQNLSRITPLFFLDRKELFRSKNGACKTSKTPWNTATSSPRWTEPASSAMQLGCVPFLMAPPVSACTSPRQKGWRALPPRLPLCHRWEMLSRIPLQGRSWTSLAQCLWRTTCSRRTTSRHSATPRSSCRRRSLQSRVNGAWPWVSELKESWPSSAPQSWRFIPAHSSPQIVPQNPSPWPHSPLSALNLHGLKVSGSLIDLFAHRNAVKDKSLLPAWDVSRRLQFRPHNGEWRVCSIITSIRHQPCVGSWEPE